MGDWNTASLQPVVDRLNARVDELQEALLVTRKLVSEAAMTGFNYHDGDWAERLFANQANITSALRAREARSQ